MNDILRTTDIPHQRAAGYREKVRRGLLLGTAATVVMSLCAIPARFFWLSELAASLRVQLIIVAVGLLIPAVFTRCVRLAAVLVICVALQMPWMVPAVPVAAVCSADRESDLSITAANIWIGNTDYDAITDALERSDSDVLAVFEVGPPLLDHLQRGPGQQYGYMAARPGPGPFGVALLARRPLTDVRAFGDNRSGGSLLATVRIGDRLCRIAAVHPISPMSPRRFRDRQKHLHQIVRHLTQWRREHEEGAVVMIGDFNLTPWSPNFCDLVRASGLKHVVVDSGYEPTWQPVPGLLFGLVIDHCLVSDDLTVVASRIGPAFGSDHRPLSVELSLPRRSRILHPLFSSTPRDGTAGFR